MFVGRVRELARLRGEFAADRPSLLVVFGRRRVGKSELLREVTRNIPHVMYQATRMSSSLNLEALKVEIARSLGADDPRDRRFHIADPLMSFWHRFVRPNLSSVMQGHGEDVWRFQINPHLEEFMGGAFEDICREHARMHSGERLPAPAQVIGQVWAGDYDIDVAGKLLDGSMLYGECKWRRTLVGEDVLDTLMERAGKTTYGRGVEDRHLLLYAQTGYKVGVLERAAEDGSRVVLHTPDTILTAPGRQS